MQKQNELDIRQKTLMLNSKNHYLEKGIVYDLASRVYLFDKVHNNNDRKMKKYGFLFLSTVLPFLWSCKDKPQTETFMISNDTMKAQTSITDYDVPELSDLNVEQNQFINNKLRDAVALVAKYCGQVSGDNFDSRTLDLTLERWRQDTDPNKKAVEDIIDIVGAAFGQGIVNELECEWKILKDQQGASFVVIHKKYFVNGFPFSSVEKASTESEPRSLNDIKLILKKAIQDSQDNHKNERLQ